MSGRCFLKWKSQLESTGIIQWSTLNCMLLSRLTNSKIYNSRFIFQARKYKDVKITILSFKSYSTKVKSLKIFKVSTKGTIKRPEVALNHTKFDCRFCVRRCRQFLFYLSLFQIPHLLPFSLRHHIRWVLKIPNAQLNDTLQRDFTKSNRFGMKKQN